MMHTMMYGTEKINKKESMTVMYSLCMALCDSLHLEVFSVRGMNQGR